MLRNKVSKASLRIVRDFFSNAQPQHKFATLVRLQDATSPTGVRSSRPSHFATPRAAGPQTALKPHFVHVSALPAGQFARPLTVRAARGFAPVVVSRAAPFAALARIVPHKLGTPRGGVPPPTARAPGDPSKTVAYVLIPWWKRLLRVLFACGGAALAVYVVYKGYVYWSPPSFWLLYLALSDPDSLRIWLARGLDPNTRGLGGVPILHFAADPRKCEDVERCVAMLLEFGADPNARSHDGATALNVIGYRLLAEEEGTAAEAAAAASVAARTASLAPATATAPTAGPGDTSAGPMPSRGASSAAIAAAAAAATAGVERAHRARLGQLMGGARVLLRGGADPNARGILGATALHYACFAGRGHIAVVDMLADAGADLEAEDSRGVRALHMAVEADDAPCVSALLRRGADITAPLAAESGLPPLGLAIKHGTLSSLRALIAAGADVNARTDYGSPLAFAVAMDNYAVTRMLTEAGAKVTADEDAALQLRSAQLLGVRQQPQQPLPLLPPMPAPPTPASATRPPAPEHDEAPLFGPGRANFGLQPLPPPGSLPLPVPLPPQQHQQQQAGPWFGGAGAGAGPSYGRPGVALPPVSGPAPGPDYGYDYTPGLALSPLSPLPPQQQQQYGYDGSEQPQQSPYEYGQFARFGRGPRPGPAAYGPVAYGPAARGTAPYSPGYRGPSYGGPGAGYDPQAAYAALNGRPGPQRALDSDRQQQQQRPGK